MMETPLARHRGGRFATLSGGENIPHLPELCAHNNSPTFRRLRHLQEFPELHETETAQIVVQSEHGGELTLLTLTTNPKAALREYGPV